MFEILFPPVAVIGGYVKPEMAVNIPLLHVYNIGKYYLYDIHSGNIVSIDKNVYQVLKDIELNKIIKLYTEVREVNYAAFDYLNNFQEKRC